MDSESEDFEDEESESDSEYDFGDDVNSDEGVDERRLQIAMRKLRDDMKAYMKDLTIKTCNKELAESKKEINKQVKLIQREIVPNLYEIVKDTKDEA